MHCNHLPLLLAILGIPIILQKPAV